MIWGKKDKKTEDTSRPQVPISTLSAENAMTDEKITPEESAFEIEDEEKGIESIVDKLKKLKSELEKCKEEKQGYLIGWQRCKADSINARKDAVATAERAGNRARNALIEDIIPALDSFDMAVGSDSWETIDSGWRSGMENIRSQLIAALANQGVTGFGNAGDAFEPALHEIVQEIDAEGKPGSIAKVLRRGYRSADKIIHPARVAVIIHKE